MSKCNSLLLFPQRTFKIGTEVFNWVQKYDADMGSRQVGVTSIPRGDSLQNGGSGARREIKKKKNDPKRFEQIKSNIKFSPY